MNKIKRVKSKIISLLTAFTLMVPLFGALSAERAAAAPVADGENAESITADKIQVGDYILLGTYNGRPIKWRCIGYGSPTNPQNYNLTANMWIKDTSYTMYEADSDAGEVPLFLADEILCSKAFDAAGTSGNEKQSSHHAQAERVQSGSNLWSDSNIHDWLNSDAPAGEAYWTCGNAPDGEHVYSIDGGAGSNPYDGEAGFLTNFTSDEQLVMMQVRQKQILGVCDADSGNLEKQYGYDYYYDSLTSNIPAGDAYSEKEYKNGYYLLSTDTVFLPDIRQANVLYRNCTADKLGTDYYKGDYFLRSPLVNINKKDTAVKAFGADGRVNPVTADCEYGIRPAFYARKSATTVSGDGSKDNPYILQKPSPDNKFSAKNIKVGDYIEMGTYYGEAVRWRCIGFDKIKGYEEDGTPIRDDVYTVDLLNDLMLRDTWEEGYLPIMISEHILSFKPFDAECTDDEKGVGTSHEYRPESKWTNKASNYWGDSNMRSWLNSAAGAGEVEWLCGNPPDKEHIDEGVNAYDGEAGFLNGFTEDELGAVKVASRKVVVLPMDHKSTTGNIVFTTEDYTFGHKLVDYTQAYGEYVKDQMFCPDAWQIGMWQWAARGYLWDCTMATKAAIRHSGFSYSSSQASGPTFKFWLSTPMRRVYWKSGLLL